MGSLPNHQQQGNPGPPGCNALPDGNCDAVRERLSLPLSETLTEDDEITVLADGKPILGPLSRFDLQVIEKYGGYAPGKPVQLETHGEPVRLEWRSVQPSPHHGTKAPTVQIPRRARPPARPRAARRPMRPSRNRGSDDESDSDSDPATAGPTPHFAAPSGTDERLLPPSADTLDEDEITASHTARHHRDVRDFVSSGAVKSRYLSDYAYRRDLARRQGFRSKREKYRALFEHSSAGTARPDSRRRPPLYRIASVNGPVLVEGISRQERDLVANHWDVIRDVLKGYTNGLGFSGLEDYEGETVAGYELLSSPDAVGPEIEWLDGVVEWWGLPASEQAQLIGTAIEERGRR